MSSSSGAAKTSTHASGRFRDPHHNAVARELVKNPTVWKCSPLRSEEHGCRKEKIWAEL
jgi:hypothetical protein